MYFPFIYFPEQQTFPRNKYLQILNLKVSHKEIEVNSKDKRNVKCTMEQTTKAQKESTGTALLFP